MVRGASTLAAVTFPQSAVTLPAPAAVSSAFTCSSRGQGGFCAAGNRGLDRRPEGSTGDNGGRVLPLPLLPPLQACWMQQQGC